MSRTVKYVLYTYRKYSENGEQKWKLSRSNEGDTVESVLKYNTSKRYSLVKEVTTITNEEIDNSCMGLKVFKMNDVEWWCTHMELKEFYSWYLKEHGLDPEDNPLDEIKECDLDSDGMWLEFEDEENIYRLDKELNGFDEVCKGGIGDIKRTSNGIIEMVSFRKAIDMFGVYDGSFCIASTEY